MAAMFSFFSAGPRPLQLYGKLPIAKDYLRIGASEGAGLALRDWMDRTFSQPAGGAGPPSLAGPMAFVLGGAADAPLLGVIRPSSDTGGLRPFPFATFVEHRRKTLLQDLESGAGRALAIWDELERAFTEHVQHRDAQSFLTAMRGRSLDLERIAAQRAETVDFTAWRQALEAEPNQNALDKLLTALRALGRQSYDGPLRLPIVRGMASVAQGHAWWLALRDCGLAARDTPPTVFLPASNSAESAAPTHVRGAAFAVFFRKLPTPEQASWLRAPVPDHALAPGDLCSARACIADAAPASEHALALSDSLRAALSKLGG